MLYADNRTDTKERALYNVYFLIRRLLSVIVLVFLTQWPFFQCNFLIVFSIINLSYMVACHPLKTPAENRIEIYNEWTIYMCSNIMAVFLNVAMPTELRILLGWVLMGIAAMNILVNLGITVWGSVQDMWSERKHKKYTKRA